MAEKKKSVTRLSKIREKLINLEWTIAQKQAEEAARERYNEAAVFKEYKEKIVEIVIICDKEK